MPKRSRTPDENESAYDVAQSIIARTDPDAGPEPKQERPKKAKRKNAAAVALGRKGGLKGGHARAAKLTKEQRAESARKAAQARWSKPTE